MFRKWIAPILVFVTYRLLYVTWRIRFHEPKELNDLLRSSTSPIIFAHFHGDELALVHSVKRYRIATISSQSKDGELMSKVIHWLGGKTSRGSSTRGGVQALKGLIRLIKNENLNTSFAVDGPKGPIYEVKPGVFEVSRLLDAPIFYGGIFCQNAFHFPKSWNKTYLPKPFTRIDIVWIGPDGPFSKELDPRDPIEAKKAKERLFTARSKAKELFDHSQQE